MSVRSRSGITSSKKEGELLSHHSEKWKQSQFKSSLSCFDQVIIWTKTSEGKKICFEENFKIWVHVHQDHTTSRNFTEKTVLLMFLQCESNPPATPKPPAWCFQLRWTKTPSYGMPGPCAWAGCTALPQLGGLLVAGGVAGDGTPALFVHPLAEGLQVSCEFLPCIDLASHLRNRQRNWLRPWLDCLFLPTTRVYSTPSTEVVKGQLISGSH